MSIIKSKKKGGNGSRSSTSYNPRMSDYGNGKSPGTIFQSDSAKYLDIQSLGSKDHSSKGEDSIGSASPIRGLRKKKDGSPTKQFGLKKKKVEFMN